MKKKREVWFPKRDEMRLQIRKMKLTAILLFSVFVSFGNSFSQIRLSVRFEKAGIRDVVQTIEDKTAYIFLYKDQIFDFSQTVTADFTDAKFEDVLKSFCDQTNTSYVIRDRQIILKEKEVNPLPTEQKPQQKTVTGKVTDSSGGPIPGVTVVVKGSTKGTITNVDGNYSITNIPENAILQVSFVGMKSKEVEISGKTVINVVLAEETIGVDEVVVIGYGTQKKSNLTSAVETVNTKVLQNRPLKTVSEMLAGVVPNLNISINSGAPDAEASLNIRGFTGINETGTPLVLVDGVEQDINMVNPSDIENISVLKDAAASAIYGSRAPNGVIIITLKEGKAGQKMSINYSGGVLFNQPIDLPHSASSVDFAKYLNMAHYNSLVAPYYGDAVIQRMQDYIDGKITTNNIITGNGRWGTQKDANANTDYFSYAFKDYSMNQTHNINIAGGSDKTSYYVGLGYLTKEGIYNSDIDNYERYSTIVKMNTKITEWLKFNINTRYTRGITERPNYNDSNNSSDSDASFMDKLSYFPNVPVFNPDGSYNILSALPMLKGLAGKINNTLNDFWITGGMELTPVKGLIIKGNMSWNNSSEMQNRTSLRVWDYEPNGEIVLNSRSTTLDKVFKRALTGGYSTVDLTATYQKQIKKHDFLIMAGYNQELKKYDNLSGINQDLYTSTVPTLSTAYGTNPTVDDEIGHWATRGYFFRGSYNFDGKYLFDFNGRYDAASKYSPETRWAFFPSLSFGYNIAKEKFWPIQKINSLKLTGSWGKLGDLAGGNYLYLPTMGNGAKTNVPLGGILPPYVTMPNIVSSDLTWAKPRTIGFGVELSAFKNRMNVDYHWYQRTTFDQMGPTVKLPEVLGVNPPQTNNAVSETRGWEFSLNYHNQAFKIAGSPLNYEARIVLSDYIGYVVKYQGNISGDRSAWTPGQIFGEVYGWNTSGIAKDKAFLQNSVLPGSLWYYQGDLMYQDLNGDGIIDNGIGNVWYAKGDQVNLGYDYPRYKYSGLFSINWKGFDVSLLLDGVGKQVRYVNNKIVFGQTGGWSTRTQLDIQSKLDYWTLTANNAFFPRIYRDSKNFGSPNNMYLLDLANLRIKNLSISYSLPSALIRKVNLSRLALDLSIENLGMIYYKSWLKLDPVMLKQDGLTYPPQRIFSLGIKVGI